MSLEFLGCTTLEQDERLMKEMDKLNYKTTTVCRCCGSANLQEIFSLGYQRVNGFPLPQFGTDPLHPDAAGMTSGVVVVDKTEYLPAVPIDVELCRDCTLVQSKHAADPVLLYGGGYWYTSGRNQTMRDALADVARAVERRVDLKAGDVVLDIGSNDGTLLRCFDGGLERVGIEPAKNLATLENYSPSMYIIRDFWGMNGLGEDFLSCHGQAKVVTAIGMMYDLEDANPFVADVAKVLAPDGVFCAQLMCLRQMLACRDVGNLCHEHLEFYSLRSLMVLLNKHGLVLEDVEENAVNGGSYRLWIGGRHSPRQPNKASIAAALHAEAILDRPATLEFWFNMVRDDAVLVREFVKSEVHGEGQRCWLYGASTKGNTMLQFWKFGPDDVEAAAERSPDKWGRLTVTGIPIKSEEDFRQAAPDYAIMLPYSFAPEFCKREAEWLRGGGRFLVPLPTPRLVWTEGGELREEKL